MNELSDGLMLMLIGMGTVFCFLTLLVICISLSSRILNRLWPEEVPAPTQVPAKQDDTLVAVITSAVHQYRKKHR